MSTNDLEEKWMRIQGYPRYEVSDKGRVRSYAAKSRPGKILKPVYNKDGYQLVTLMDGDERSKDNKPRHFFIHRLVAQAFIPMPPNLRRYGREDVQIDHINAIKTDNRKFNLRWATPKINRNNPASKPAFDSADKQKSYPVYVYDENLTLLSAFTSTKDAGRQLGKSQGNVAACAGGVLRRYLGLIFSYVELTDIKQREEIEESKAEERERRYHSILEACHKYYRSHRREAIEYQSQWQKNHPDIARERSAKYYREHREEILRKKRERERSKKAEAKKNKRGGTGIPEGILPKEC